jgi:serine phosphatase RsbU (regulator of sigma subunit)
LLPPSLPDIQGVTLAARYVAAEQVLEVGGDFYDVFDAGYRAWALSIGDVCGRGPRAAALTGLIRHTLRSLALRERNPASMLASLNAVLHRDLDDPGLFCTVLYGILRQRADGLVLRYANAGHPPPMLLSTNGRITERHEGGLVLGPFPSGTWTTETVKLRPSDTVVFYTDGVSEARRGDEQFGDEALRTTLAAFAGADAETIAAGLTDAAAAFAEGAVPDDMAVLVVQATTTV